MEKRNVDTMVVSRIDVKSNHKQLVLKEKNKVHSCCDYFATADLDVNVKVGDKIEFEPVGVNFGYFIRVIT